MLEFFNVQNSVLLASSCTSFVAVCVGIATLRWRHKDAAKREEQARLARESAARKNPLVDRSYRRRADAGDVRVMRLHVFATTGRRLAEYDIFPMPPHEGPIENWDPVIHGSFFYPALGELASDLPPEYDKVIQAELFRLNLEGPSKILYIQGAYGASGAYRKTDVHLHVEHTFTKRPGDHVNS